MNAFQNLEMKITHPPTTGKILALVASSLLATSASYGLTIQFLTSEGTQPSNVGTVTVSQVDANTVKVLLDLIDTSDPAPKYGLINTGGPHTPFAFQVSGTEVGVTATFIQPAGGTYSFGLFSLNLGGGGNTPYGTYGIAIDSTAGNGSVNGYYGDLEFNLTRTSGLSVSDFVANSDGGYFSADMTDGQNTGAQVWKTPTTVPDGGKTLMLLGVALGGLGVVRRLLPGA